MEWILKEFNQLTGNELYSVLKARVDVFVVEQQCAYPELDGVDEECLHLFHMEDGEVMAYARLVPAGEKYEQASIGRVLVHPSKRKMGLGRVLVQQSIDHILEQWNPKAIRLQAQSHLTNFYASFGFAAISDEYDDDGIPHVDMLLKVR